MTPDNTEKKQRNKGHDNILPYMWEKGTSGNPKGRPKGSISPRDTIRKMFEANPTTFEDFLTKYLDDPNNRKHLVEMLDGKPTQSIDTTITEKPYEKLTDDELDGEINTQTP